MGRERRLARLEDIIVRSRLGSVALLLLMLAGCRSTPRMSPLGNYDHVWDVCTDVVSSLMHLDEANKAEGRIRAHLASKWERSKTEIVLTQVRAEYDIEVNVYREAFTPYTTAAGIMAYERWRPAGRDDAMEQRIARQIRAGL